jgi:membrane protein YdbS with pleckstrin-like domain
MDKLIFGPKYKNASEVRSMDNIDQNEHILAIAYQHPFALIIMFVAAFVSFIVAMLIIGLLLPTVFGSTTAYAVVAFFASVSIVILCLIIAVATFVYRQSRLTVTDRNVIQVLQQGIYNRKVSQISLANVEDVTSHQKGFFANLFNFGTVKIETAGEQANFVFSYCPDPNKVSKIILDAKDDFLISTGQAGSYRNSLKPMHYEYPEEDKLLNKVMVTEMDFPYQR